MDDRLRTGSKFHHQEPDPNRKPRFLCLHGFRASGEILREQVSVWPESIIRKMDLVFVDAPYPSQEKIEKSDVDGSSDRLTCYEWFQFINEFTDVMNLKGCLEYIEECMIKHAPIDGFLGFSQGAILSAALPGMQAQGVALTKVPKVKFIVIIAGAKLIPEKWKAYASPIEQPSIHFIGKEDSYEHYGLELVNSFVDPVIIHHSEGHTVPRLDNLSLPLMTGFLDRIQNMLAKDENHG